MEVIIRCPRCKKSYDSSDRLPISLECGHTFCKVCTAVLKSPDGFLRCPEDDIVDSRAEYTINWALVPPSGFTNSIVLKKETCPLHNSPINMICRTCDMNLCSPCVRDHIAHDLYEIDNPEILKEMRNKMSRISDELAGACDSVQSYAKTIVKEMEKLEQELSSCEALIEGQFEDMFMHIDSKFQEDLEIIKSNFNDKLALLEKLSDENSSTFSKYYQQFFSLTEINKEFLRKQFTDRAVTSAKIVRIADQLDFCGSLEMFELPVLIQRESFAEFKLGDLTIFEKSPLDALQEEFNCRMEDIRDEYEIYQRSKPEEQLSIEIKSTSFCVFLHAEDEHIAIAHVLRQVCLDILTLDFLEANDDVKNLITEKLRIPDLVLKDLSLYIQRMRNQIVYAKGLVLAFRFLKQRRFKELLKILHYFVMKWSCFRVAEELLNIVFLRMCSEGFIHARTMNLIGFTEILKSLVDYTRFHLHHESVLLSQVTESIEFYKNQLSQMNDYHRFFGYIQIANEYLEIMKLPCEHSIGLDLPIELKDVIDECQAKDLMFWRDDGLSKEYLELLYETYEELTPWRRALANINRRGAPLTENEMIDLESVLCETNRLVSN